MTAGHDLVLPLLRFWAAEGCDPIAPCDLPLGDGLAHPQALLALLGGGARRLVYAQPVRRPRDGRHRLPDRLARFTQLEVILAPAPADLFPIYLRSLRALRFELELHDLRFVAGSWRQRELGAHAPGWSVRVDGLGVSRVSMLQEVAGVPLAAPAAEIAYGVERLASVVHGVPAARDLLTAGEKRAEAELVRQAGEVADVAVLRRRFEEDIAEADACLRSGLALAACEALARSAWAIELLAARGALVAAERTTQRARLVERLAAVAAGLRGESDDGR